jgi:hypothetical protein
MGAAVGAIEFDAKSGPVVVGGVEFDARAAIVIVGQIEFDLQPARVIVGQVEFDVAHLPILDYVIPERETPPGLGYRRATRSSTTISSPKPAPKRYDEHALRQDMERVAALELADEEVVLAFLFGMALS